MFQVCALIAAFHRVSDCLRHCARVDKECSPRRNISWMTMSSIESYSCFQPLLSLPLFLHFEHAVLYHNCNGKYVKIYCRAEAGVETLTCLSRGKDFIIYETLMLQLEAHKINDAVSFISSNEQFLNYTEEQCKRW
jgi:hypothetical protein